LKQQILKPLSQTTTRKPASIQHPESHFDSLWEDGDFNTPWSMVIIVLGFLCAWAVTTILEHFGWTRHVWHLPLVFAALAVLFGTLIGLFFAP
jgi:hypothetical protein